MATILVADDDIHIRRVLSMWLRKKGHQVLQAGNGLERIFHETWEGEYCFL